MVRSAGDFIANESAAVAPTIALSLFALVGAAGIAFDYARLATLDTELQNAADQAALAAATQLNRLDGARNRGEAVATGLLENLTLLGNDGNASGPTVDIIEVVFYNTQQQAVSDATGNVCPATDITSSGTAADEEANYVCVRTTTRTANYALTPVVGAFSGSTSAMAVATLEAAVCNTPPLMICNPQPGLDFETSVPRGTGVRVTGHGNTKACHNKDGEIVVDPDTGETITCSPKDAKVTSWAPGDFGFLKVGSGKNEDLVGALAFQYLDFDCTTDDGQEVAPGNPQGLYEAINTRFDIYDFPTGTNGTILAACNQDPTLCPASTNPVKDMVNTTLSGPGKGKGSKSCKLAAGNSGKGWKLPDKPYYPKDMSATTYTANTVTHDATKGAIDAMGFPRDLCHYTSSKIACSATYSNKIGNGQWGRQDYWNTNHNGVTKPADFATMSRYDFYVWEKANGLSTDTDQSFNTSCRSGSVAPGIDRRVLTVAIVNNCAADYTDPLTGQTWLRLTGTSKAAHISEYIDMFLVQPVVDGSGGRGNGDVKDSIYMEYIGTSPSGANGLQSVVKEVPLLVK